MELKCRLTHSLAEIRVDEIETTLFKSRPEEIDDMIDNLLDVVDDLKKLKGETQEQQQENIFERERFRAIDFAKWFSDFNGLTWEEKRVSKERLNNLYKQYLKTLGGGI